MADTKELHMTERGHIKCPYCEQAFSTTAAERRHVSKDHPDESALHCPACKATRFKMPSDLMGHIERGRCPIIKLDELNRRRQRKMGFRRQLGIQGSVRNNFARFIDRRAPGTSPSSSSQNPGLVGKHDEHPNRQPSVSSTTTESTTFSSQAPGETPVRSDGTVNSNIGLLIARQSQSVQEWEQVNKQSGPRLAEEEVRRDRFSGKYHCSRGRCQKTFKSKEALAAHLHSSAHSDVRYTCPECHKQFHSLEGMTAHAEDTRSRCGISRTDKFATYLEQLTGGIVEVMFVGGRVKYQASEIADAEFDGALAARRDGYNDLHHQSW